MTTETAIDQVRTEAIRWAELLIDGDGHLTAAERGEFHQWLMADESHQREFRAHILILNLAREQSDETRDELVVLAMNASKRTLRRKAWIVGLAASALLTLGLGGWLVYQNQAAAHITTVAGMTREVTLPDGSVVHLNTRTDLRWTGRAAERRVALLEGEALFEVQHDAARPFTVVVDDSEIRVLGTRFNVRRRQNEEVVLTVLEGSVAVSQPGSGGARSAWRRTLKANEQIVYGKAGVIRDIHLATGSNAARWREGVLEFEDESLSTIVADLERYTDRSIVVRDPQLAQLRLGGQLNVHDSIKSSLGLLEKLAPVTAHQNGDTFVLDYRHDAAGENR